MGSFAGAGSGEPQVVNKPCPILCHSAVSQAMQALGLYFGAHAP